MTILIFHHDEPRPPLFTEQDVTETMKRLQGVDYEEENDISGAKVRFRDAGHILGSAMLEVSASGRKVVFSGDLGRPGAPLIRIRRRSKRLTFSFLNPRTEIESMRVRDNKVHSSPRLSKRL